MDLYATGQDDRAFALDAHTGRPIWLYQRQLPTDIRPCCGRVNRGLAILGDKVFMATLDAHVIALDAKTGSVRWDVVAADYRTGYSFTVAPLAVKDLIVIGVSGGEYGIRGFIDAYDAATGQRKWRFYTVPGPGEPGPRHLAGRFMEGRRRSRLEHGNLRSGHQSDLLADWESISVQSRRGARRRQLVQQLPPGTRRRYG